MAERDEELGIDFRPALEAIDQLDQRVDQLVAKISDGISGAFADGGRAGLDALSALDAPIKLNVDDSEIVLAADTIASLDTEPIVVPVLAEAESLQAAEADIEALIAAGQLGVETVVTVDDTALVQAEDELEELRDKAAEPIEAVVTVDESGLAEAGNALESIATGAVGASSGLRDVGGAAQGAGTDLAFGALGAKELGQQLTGLGGGAATGVVAVGAFLGVAVDKAIEADAAVRRLNSTFGELAPSLEALDLTGLNQGLSEFSIRIGADDDALRVFAARIFQAGTGSGVAADEVNRATQSFIELAGKVSVANPQLGDADEIVNNLTASFARGGRALVPYGFAISAAEIQTRALKNTSKDSAAELTVFDRSVAGSQLVVEKYGESLDTAFGAGLDSPLVKLRSLKQTLEEAVEAAGTESIDAFVGALVTAVPVLVEVVGLLGEVGATALPLLATGLELVAPVLELALNIIDAIPEPAREGIVVFGLLAFAAQALAVKAALLAPALATSLAPLLPLAAAIGAVAFVVSQFGDEERKAIPVSGAYTAALRDAAAATAALVGPTTTAAQETAILRDELDKAQRAAALDKLKPLAGALSSIGVAADEAAGLLGNDSEALESIAAILGPLAIRTGAYKGELKDLNIATFDQATALFNQIKGSGELTDEQAKLLDALFALNQERVIGIEQTRRAALAGEDEAVAIEIARGEMFRFGVASEDAAKSTEHVATAAETAARDNETLNESLRDAADGFDTLRDEIDKTLSTFDKLAGRPADIAKQLIEVKDKTADYAKSLKDSKGATDLNTQAGRDNVKSLTDVLESIRAVTESQIQGGASVKEATKSYEDQIAGLRKVATQSGLTKAEFDFLLATLGATPEQIETTLELSGVTEAVDALEPYNDLLAHLPLDKQTEIRQLGAVDAQAAVDLLQESIDKLPREKKIEISIETAVRQISGQTSALLGLGPDSPEAIKQAEDLIKASQRAFGGIDYPRHYALGGISDRSPRIVPAGSNVRIFGEPDTGGEAFIPLAADARRSRAVGITADVADQFGYNLTPKSLAVGQAQMSSPGFDDSRMVNTLAQGFEALSGQLAGLRGTVASMEAGVTVQMQASPGQSAEAQGARAGQAFRQVARSR